MGKSLPALLFLTLGLVALAPPGVRAATLYGGDYARIGVPDLAQAVAFFRDVLGSGRDTCKNRTLGLKNNFSPTS